MAAKLIESSRKHYYAISCCNGPAVRLECLSTAVPTQAIPSRASLILLVSGLLWNGKSATLVWINPAGGNWSNAADWDPVGVPGAGDIAKITTAGDYTVTNDLPTTWSERLS